MKTKEQLITEYQNEPLKPNDLIVIYKNSYLSDYTKH